MKIRIINPNTTWSMTEKMAASARAVARPGTEIVAVSPSMGPASIESHYDEALAVPGLLQEVARGEREGVDGYVIACFGDPGLLAARELARGPVVGIAQGDDDDDDTEISVPAGTLDDGAELLPLASITVEQAIAAAQGAAEGAIGEVDLEYVGDRLVFNVDVGEFDVKVDAHDAGVVAKDADD